MLHGSKLPLRGAFALGLIQMLPATTTLHAASAETQASPWSYSAGVSVKEAYDSNVYLQDIGPLADRESFVTTVIPNLGVAFKPCAAFNASFSYAPEWNFFHSEPDEDFALHRTGLTLGGKVKDTAWDISNTFIAIDGGSVGPTFSAPGGAPAAGGPQVRDRRDAFIERGQFRITHKIGSFFVRPVVSGYYHDFRTEQRTTPGYLNFVDRNDLNGGADLGVTVVNDASVVVGYRYGFQNQAQLFPEINPVHYDNSYHRLLFGAEGKPCDWLKLAISFGPEFRTFDGISAPGFMKQEETYLYVDSTITLLPTKADTLTFTARRFQQPGFGGRSVYTDSTYEFAWRHKVSDKLTIGAGARAYNTDFLLPTERNDWIYSGNGLISFAFNKHLSAELSYSYDSAETWIPNTPAREYTKHLVALGVRCILK